jgi:small basic protein
VTGFDTASVLSLLIGTVLPLLVGLVTGLKTHPVVRGVTLLLAASVTAVLTQWLGAVNSHTAFTWQPVVVGAVLTFVTGVASHYGIWQHTALPVALQGFPQSRASNPPPSAPTAAVPSKPSAATVNRAI